MLLPSGATAERHAETRTEPAAGEAPLPEWRTRAVHIVLYVGFTVLALYYFTGLPDDVFIGLRVARNLLSGAGPVFNQGERVESFTSPLHLVVGVVAILLPGSAALWLKVASFLFGLAAVRQLFMIVHLVFVERFWRVVAMVSIAGGWTLAASSFNGLETTLAAFLTATVTLRVLDGRSRHEVLTTAIVAFASVMTRPEAVLLIAAAALPASVEAARSRTTRPIRWCLAATAGVLVVGIARFIYYGELLPNTFWAKRIPLGRAIPKAIEYLRFNLGRIETWSTELIGWWMAQATLALLAVAFAAGFIHVAIHRRELLPLQLVVVAQLAFVLWSGGDWMGGGRFIAPVAGLLAISTTLGVRALAVLVGRTSASRVVFARWAAGALAMWFVFFGIYTHPNRFRFALDDRSLLALDGSAWPVTASLFRCAPKGSWVAFSEMGYGPWVREDLRFIDLRGLADKAIARNPPHPDGRETWGVVDEDWTEATGPVARYVLRRRPAMIIFDSEVAVTTGPLYESYRRVGLEVEGVQPHLRRDLDCDS